MSQFIVIDMNRSITFTEPKIPNMQVVIVSDKTCYGCKSHFLRKFNSFLIITRKPIFPCMHKHDINVGSLL